MTHPYRTAPTMTKYKSRTYKITRWMLRHPVLCASVFPIIFFVGMFIGTPRVITRTVEIDSAKNISHAKAIKEIEGEINDWGGASMSRVCWMRAKYKGVLTEEENAQLINSYSCSK